MWVRWMVDGSGVKDVVCCAQMLLVGLVFLSKVASVYPTIHGSEVVGGGSLGELVLGRVKVDCFLNSATSGFFMINIFHSGMIKGSWLMNSCKPKSV